MTTSVKRRNGGYFTVPNRWIDAGYMAAAPGSVTQVYLHLSRWADNGTLASSQPMKLIARKCGISEDVARKAVRTLEAWGVLDRDPESGRGASNTWYLNDLPDKAPEYPNKVPPKESGGPDKVGPQESGGTYQPDYYQPDNQYQPEEYSVIARQTSSTERAQPNSPVAELVEVWAQACNGGEWPVNKGRALGHAKLLVEGGITADDARALIEWLRGQRWVKGGIDLGLMVSQVDKWQAARTSKPGAVERRLVY